MTLFIFAMGATFGLAVGVYLGGEIIAERDRELKYLRRELKAAADKVVKEWWET